MTMHDEFTDKLSDYLDGELSADEHAAVAAHLRGCQACALVLDELTEVVARARTVTPRPPERDLWPGVLDRIEHPRAASVATFARRAPQRISFTLPQLAAAAVLLIAVSAGGAWWLAGGPNRLREESTAEQARRAPQVAQPVPAAPASGDVNNDAAAGPVAQVGLADAQYDAAVADLEKAVKQGRGRLDSSTITIVEHNLQIIDQAIAQAREALAADPANTYLSSHLVEARRRKLDLLRRAAALAETD